MLPDTDNAATEHNESTVSINDIIDKATDKIKNSNVHETTNCAADSITKLKQVVNVESSTSQGGYKNEIKALERESKRCDDCKIKPSHQKKNMM